jgi:hypothetical protein
VGRAGYSITDTFSHLYPVIVELTLGGETIETVLKQLCSTVPS